jgi:tetratricopeptide (TPR) repeat protein
MDRAARWQGKGNCMKKYGDENRVSPGGFPVTGTIVAGSALLMVMLIPAIVLLLSGCGSSLWFKSGRNSKAMEFFNEGEFFFSQEEYPNALKFFQKAEELNPAIPLLFQRIGLCYAHTRFYDKAREYFLKEIARDPKNMGACLDLGMVYSRLNQPEKAEKQYRHVLEKEPENIKAHLNLGILLLNRLNQREEGITELENYLRLAPFSRKRQRIEASIHLLKEGQESDVEDAAEGDANSTDEKRADPAGTSPEKVRTPTPGAPGSGVQENRAPAQPGGGA